MSYKKVSIDFDIPDNVTEEQFEEWFKYKVIDWGGCSCDNPLLEMGDCVGNLVSNYYIW